MNTQVIAQTDLLDAAGNMLACHDQRDRVRSGLLELTSISRHGIATLSGLNDYDYQTLQSLPHGNKPLAQMRTVNKTAIPNKILEHLKHINCHCKMGFFPEIGSAWITIDSDIYIWTYEQSRDVAYYDGLNHLIVSVGLVRPKEDVFVSDVKYLLVLTTPLEIVVLGVTFVDRTSVLMPVHLIHNTNVYEEIQLMNKPIFVLGADNVTFNVVEGSSDGRIFLGGRDGCLYEIHYQAESTWFSTRCKKINHSQGIISYIMPSFLKVFEEIDPIEQIVIDNSRNLLYILTERSSIEAWHFGKKMRRLGRITQNDIVRAAGRIANTVDPSIFNVVKAICPLTKDDCTNLHLIAVTQSGVRLYFSTFILNATKFNIKRRPQMSPIQPLVMGSPQPQPQQQPQVPTQPMVGQHMPPKTQPPAENERHCGFYLLHVRLPPGFTSNTKTHDPKLVHAAYYCEGTLLMATTLQQDKDLLWSVSATPFPNSTNLTESSAIEPLDGVAWSMTEVQDRTKARQSSLLYNARTPRKVAMLTNNGIHIMALLKPVDLFHQLLTACNGPHHEAVKAFFQAQTEREACVICLLIATSDEHRGTVAATWAVQAFMLYGGEPCFANQLNASAQQLTYNRNVTQNPNTANSPHIYMSTPMKNPPGGGSPTMNRWMMSNTTLQISQLPLSPISAGQQSTSLVPSIATPTKSGSLVYSAKHDGLYVFVARLMRPIWKMQCVNDDLRSNLDNEDCKFLLSDLCSIRSFLDANSVHDLSCTFRNTFQNPAERTNSYNTIIMSNNNVTVNEQRNATEQAHAEEKRSLTALSYFIKHTCEVISLWNILCEHQFQTLASQLTKEQQHLLKNCTFRDLTLKSSEVCAFMIITLIKSYLEDNASVSRLSTKLREMCPNLYRHGDAVSYEAIEILMSAKTTNSESDRIQKLHVALKMCKDAAPTLLLHSVCQEFINADFFEGVVELAATCATKSDIEELGIQYYNNNEPPEDREGYSGFTTRMACYKVVRFMLDQVYQSICNNQSQQEQTEFNFLEAEPNPRDEQNQNPQIMRIVVCAMYVKDPLMHVTVYEWLLVHKLNSALLNIIEPSLGEFLERSLNSGRENLNIVDLLWKYYEKNGHHSQAAHILDNLAMKHNADIQLDQRIDFLVRAVMCMHNESFDSSIGDGVLLKELEDKLDIARVQNSVLSGMTELASTNHEAKKAVNELNITLYDITQLYQKFAEPFDLWECQLLIFNCSHHNDPLLIESVWGNIIDKAVEGPGSSFERSTRLFTKIETLVLEFGESGLCFPFAFIIRELEIKACQLLLPEGTVAEMLVRMNLDIELIMENYSRMISMNERVWANEGNEWHLLQSAICVITILANNAHNIWYRSKCRIVGKALDLVAVCLNVCYQRPGTDNLQIALKELQSRLQRLLA